MGWLLIDGQIESLKMGESVVSCRICCTPSGFNYIPHNYPSIKDGKYAGVIGVGGLVLARIPEEIAKSREEYFAKRTQDREEAIANDPFKEQHPSMPISKDRQTRVTCV